MFVPTVQVLSMNEKLKYYMELDIFFMQVAGYTLEDLKGLFAKGYTLEPPTYASMSELAELAEKGE